MPKPRETGGGTGFMYDGPEARTLGVMQTPRPVLSIFARPTMGVSRAQVSIAA